MVVEDRYFFKKIGGPRYYTRRRVALDRVLVRLFWIACNDARIRW